MTPPEPAVPVPATVRPPEEPVLFRKMPFPPVPEPPPAVIDLKVTPDDPIVLLSTFRAVPLVVVSVLFEPVTLTVPPPIALKALLPPVFAVTPPVRLIVALVLLVSDIPVPPS